MANHLQPTADIAARALLPADPGVALALAQELLERPLMANHARGLWGYTGTAGDGAPLTVQSTGTGGPAVAIVVAELAALGLRRGVLLSEGVARPGGPPPGAIVHAREALGLDGTSRALGAEDLQVDPALAGDAVVLSVDVAPDDPPASPATVADRNAAAGLAAARRAGIALGVVLVVVARGEEALDEEERRTAGLGAGAVGARLLGAAVAT